MYIMCTTTYTFILSIINGNLSNIICNERDDQLPEHTLDYWIGKEELHDASIQLDF